MSESDELQKFEARYPSWLNNVHERITDIARVVPRGRLGTEIRTLLENIAIAGVIAGQPDPSSFLITEQQMQNAADNIMGFLSSSNQPWNKFKIAAIILKHSSPQKL